MSQMFGNGTIPPLLKDSLEGFDRPAVAFSGGADSTYLLYAAVACNTDVCAYFVKTAFQTQRELERAVANARAMDADICIIDLDVLKDQSISANPANRCYLCKKAVFGAIERVAGEDGRRIILDATNASDDPSDRPGMKALEELGIRSPLKECQISKKEIRELSRRAGLPTWNLPSDSCLATRIPAGTPLTLRNLSRTEEAEREAGLLGLSDFRIRTRGDSPLVEVREEQEELLREIRPELEKMLSEYYAGEPSYGRRVPKP